MTQVRTFQGKSYDHEVAKAVLEQHGIAATKKNLTDLLKLAGSFDVDKNKYLSGPELATAAMKLAAEITGRSSLKPTQTLVAALKKAPAEVDRYSFSLSTDHATLTIDPSQLSPFGVRSAGAGKKSVEIGHTIKGGATVTILGEHEEALQMTNGKWATATLASLVKKPADLARLESQGYNLQALRKVLVVKTEDGESTTFAVRQQGIDADSPVADGPGSKMPGFGGKAEDPTRGLVAICTEVTIVDFKEGGPVFTVKKPVLYLYPERRTSVRVEVTPVGRFIAQYPETANGRWDLVAMPDGMLFDPESERRFSYLFWEAAQGELAIDPRRAFTVRAEEAEVFLEEATQKLALNDRERTDFISYWIASLRRNPVSLVQFLIGDECEAYAKLKIEPAPDSTIRVFMLFQELRSPISVGAPELPTLKRHRFTAVEWGGANLDE
ncbi:MAG: hypothetical protein IT384_32080 [Deltaproteobacteria bacterium]|nr:hypothetical protein [Deltaproteobacteria bacterium]